MDYTREELNEILLSKDLSDYYIAMVEHRRKVLTEEEYKDLTSRDDTVYVNSSKESYDELENHFKDSNLTEEDVNKIMRVFNGFYSRIRQLGCLTLIDGKVYDIVNLKYIDLKRNKIISYENLTDLFDESNARIKLATPEEEPFLECDTVGLDVDDESIIEKYEEEHAYQKDSKDLTRQFLFEAKKTNMKLTRKK